MDVLYHSESLALVRIKAGLEREHVPVVDPVFMAKSIGKIVHNFHGMFISGLCLAYWIMK